MVKYFVIIGFENELGVVILKWLDNRDLYMLTTMHGIETVKTVKRNKKLVYKPTAFID